MWMYEESGLEGLSRTRVREWAQGLPIDEVTALVPVWPVVVLPEPVAGEPAPVPHLAGGLLVRRAVAALAIAHEWAGVSGDLIPASDGRFYRRDSGEVATVRECEPLRRLTREDWAAATMLAAMIEPPHEVLGALAALAAEARPEIPGEADAPVRRHHRTRRPAYALGLSGQLVELTEGAAECREVAHGLTLPGPRAEYLRSCGRTRLAGYSLECLAADLWPGRPVISLVNSPRRDDDHVAIGATWQDWGTLAAAQVVSGLPVVEFGGHTGREDDEPSLSLLAYSLSEGEAAQRLALAYHCPVDVAAAALICWSADEYDTRQQAQRLAWADLHTLQESRVLRDPHGWGASDYIGAYLAAHEAQPVIVHKPGFPGEWHVIESNRWAARRAAMAAYRKVAELA